MNVISFFSVLKDLHQIFPIAAFEERLCQILKLFGINKSHAKRDFLDAGYFKSLAFFYGLNEHPRLKKGIVGSGVKPGIAAAKNFDAEIPEAVFSKASLRK